MTNSPSKVGQKMFLSFLESFQFPADQLGHIWNSQAHQEEISFQSAR